MGLRGGGDVPEPEAPARSPVSLNRSRYCLGTLGSSTDSWALIECVRLRTWSPGMFGW